MGGAYGHLLHLHEDWDLTFADIINVFSDAGRGTLKNVTEKTDGMNLVFTWDVSSSLLRVARSTGDIKRGGLDARALAQRFPNRTGDVIAAFTNAFDTLDAAMRCVSVPVLYDVFGPSGNVWYSAEVIDPTCPNVIRYDEACVVLHAHGSLRLCADGTVNHMADAPGISALELFESDIARRLAPRKLHMPQRIKVIAPTDAVDRAREDVRTLAFVSGLSLQSTLRDYLSAVLGRMGWVRRFSPDVASALVSRAVGASGAPNLAQIKRLVKPEKRVEVDEWAGNLVEMAKAGSGMIEEIVYRFSVRLLDGVRSTMVTDHEKEVDRIRKGVALAMRDVSRVACLEKHVQKLSDLSDIGSSTEGIVFRFGDKAYKMTGAFAPVNQILGASRYGRT